MVMCRRNDWIASKKNTIFSKERVVCLGDRICCFTGGGGSSVRLLPTNTNETKMAVDLTEKNPSRLGLTPPSLLSLGGLQPVFVVAAVESYVPGRLACVVTAADAQAPASKFKPASSSKLASQNRAPHSFTAAGGGAAACRARSVSTRLMLPRFPWGGGLLRSYYLGLRWMMDYIWTTSQKTRTKQVRRQLESLLAVE